MPAPSHQPQRLRLALPALTGIAPPTLHKCAFDQALHVLRQSQLEQIVDAATLRLAHHPFTGNAAVAAQQSRPAVAWNAVDELPQSDHRMGAGVLVAGCRLPRRPASM